MFIMNTALNEEFTLIHLKYITNIINFTFRNLYHKIATQKCIYVYTQINFLANFRLIFFSFSHDALFNVKAHYILFFQ